MTVSTTSNKVTRDGDGIILSFQYDFKIFADGDLDVYIRDTNGTETLQKLSTQITLSQAQATIPAVMLSLCPARLRPRRMRLSSSASSH